MPYHQCHKIHPRSSDSRYIQRPFIALAPIPVFTQAVFWVFIGRFPTSGRPPFTMVAVLDMQTAGTLYIKSYPQTFRLVIKELSKTSDRILGKTFYLGNF